MSCDTCNIIKGTNCIMGIKFCEEYGCQNHLEMHKEKIDGLALLDAIPRHERTLQAKKPRMPLSPVKIGSYKFKSKK